VIKSLPVLTPGTLNQHHLPTGSETRPAATIVIVAGLLDPRWKVEIEAEAIIAS
jgi:enamine deaminase RidA (YjgF/YER057c/UK114 family)